MTRRQFWPQICAPLGLLHGNSLSPSKTLLARMNYIPTYEEFVERLHLSPAEAREAIHRMTNRPRLRVRNAILEAKAWLGTPVHGKKNKKRVKRLKVWFQKTSATSGKAGHWRTKTPGKKKKNASSGTKHASCPANSGGSPNMSWLTQNRGECGGDFYKCGTRLPGSFETRPGR